MKSLRLALIAGPQYDGLLEHLPAFEAETGYRLDVAVRLPHMELNARLAAELGTPAGDYDLISTHSKYSPSQAGHLYPLDDWVSEAELADFLPAVVALCRGASGALYQLPRNFDARLLFYRSDIIAAPPQTWGEALDLMRAHRRPGLYGFAFPGRQSGLFGTFYELLGMAGGDLFEEAGGRLRPVFNSPAGEWALAYLHRLHAVERVTPPDLLEHWYFDEVSARFRAGEVLMVGDWPGYYGLYRRPETCAVMDRFDVAVYPAGPAGLRRAYAGGHAFAIPRAARDPEGGLALARYLTSEAVQRHEAVAGGHTPVRQSVLAEVRAQQTGRDARRLAALEETMQQHALIPPKFARYPLVEDILWTGVQSALLGQRSPAAALARMAAQVEEVVQ